MATNSKARQRQQIRQTFLKKRLQLNARQQTEYALALVEQVKQHSLFSEAKNIAIYLSFNGELDTKPLINYFWANDVVVFVPVIHPFSKGHLLFQALKPDSRLKKNQFGIAEPLLNVQDVCPVYELDILFTPLLAFDLVGNRLGMGGGFYDRTLSNLPSSKLETNNTGQTKKRSTKVIGLAHDLQRCDQLPIESWDIPLPYILSPSKLYSFA